MNTYRATVRVTINGRSQTVKTEVRAPSTKDARWLLWAMYGLQHSKRTAAQVMARLGPRLRLARNRATRKIVNQPNHAASPHEAV